MNSAAIEPEIAAADAGPSETAWTAEKVGMIAFLCSEAAFFATLITAYITYIGASSSGPTPSQSLDLRSALIGSVFLVTSSVTILPAVKGFKRDAKGHFAFWISLTMLLGVLFLGLTAYEWYGLIVQDGLTIRRNLFGSTYFTLIGFHATHVSMGLFVMGLLLTKSRRATIERTSQAPELTSWYWHLVDAVWVVIVLVVYVFGR